MDADAAPDEHDAVMDANDESLQRKAEELGPDKIEELRKELDEWETISVKIAVIGQSGVGKSSFINKFRGLEPGDKDKVDSKGNLLYAKVGLTETTGCVTEYEFEGNPMIKLFDLPGAGTKNFPIESYPDKINITQFNAFIILTANRFMQNDTKIIQEIMKIGKPYFFARTKMDEALTNYAKENPDLKTAETFRESWEGEKAIIKTNCINNLREKNTEKVFLLSSDGCKKIKIQSEPKDKIIIEFPDNQRLKNSVIKSLPILQKTALIFTVGPESMETITMKVEELKSRIWKIALVSAAGGGVPLPGLSIAIDVSLINYECNFQKKQLGIDQKTLKKKADLLNLIQENLIEIILEKSSDTPLMAGLCRLSLQSSDLMQLVKRPDYKVWLLNLSRAANAASVGIALSTAAETALPYILPVLGSAIAAAMSGSTTYGFLRGTLSVHQKLAMKCLELWR